jgi:hypothetical protein
MKAVQRGARQTLRLGARASHLSRFIFLGLTLVFFSPVARVQASPQALATRPCCEGEESRRPRVSGRNPLAHGDEHAIRCPDEPLSARLGGRHSRSNFGLRLQRLGVKMSCFHPGLSFINTWRSGTGNPNPSFGEPPPMSFLTR